MLRGKSHRRVQLANTTSTQIKQDAKVSNKWVNREHRSLMYTTTRNTVRLMGITMILCRIKFQDTTIGLAQVNMMLMSPRVINKWRCQPNIGRAMVKSLANKTFHHKEFIWTIYPSISSLTTVRRTSILKFFKVSS